MAENLDLACARLGDELSRKGDRKQLEKLLRNAEAVLEERGPYALFLYLDGEGKLGQGLRDKCLEFLRDRCLVDHDTDDWKQAVQTLAQDLDALLLARDLLRSALIYGFEHVRART